MKHTRKEKVKALLLYICSKIPQEFSGVIKINKIMWFSETETMYRTWEPLTGQCYLRQRFGPVALNINIVREELIKEGKLKELNFEHHESSSTRRAFVTTKVVDISRFFSEEQISIIEEQIDKYKITGAIDISELSHDSIWASLDDGDTMPLEAYALKPEYTEEQEKSLETFTAKREEIGYV